LEISALFSIPFLWFAQNSVENSIGLFGVRDKSFYMSFSGLSTVFLRRTEIFFTVRLKIFTLALKFFHLTLKFSAWDSNFSPPLEVGDAAGTLRDHTVPLRDRA
jgi:hypothetical protein